MASNLALLNSAGMSIHFNFERIPWCRGSPGSGQLAASAVVVKHELFVGQIVMDTRPVDAHPPVVLAGSLAGQDDDCVALVCLHSALS